MSYREKMLDETKGIVCGNRDKEYGKPENNFQDIANLWNGYLKNICKLPALQLLSEVDVANMMMLLKIARSESNKKHLDNFVDIAGYAACAYEIEANDIDENSVV